MSNLNWLAIEAAQRVSEPFEHAIVTQSLDPAVAARIPAEFPAIRQPGSFPLSEATPGPALAGVIDELRSDRFRLAMERLFDVDLSGRPMVATLRGQCGGRDGRVHTDSASKILSLLLYLNEDWNPAEGRLRLLRQEDSLSDPALEVAPLLGTMVAFLRSDCSWHGHTQYLGQRRVLQLNYLKSQRDGIASTVRHRLSAVAKRLTGAPLRAAS